MQKMRTIKRCALWSQKGLTHDNIRTKTLAPSAKKIFVVQVLFGLRKASVNADAQCPAV